MYLTTIISLYAKPSNSNNHTLLTITLILQAIFTLRPNSLEQIS